MRRFKFKLLISIVGAALVLPACLGDTAGIDPPNNELVYPVALASINDDSHLLVVNSNFDLQYNAGTLVAYQLSQLDSVSTGKLRYDEYTGTFILPDQTDTDAVTDVDTDVDTDAEKMLDEYCSGGRTETYCNLDPQEGIVVSETIRLGAYASDLNITPAGDRALIPVRGERAIIAVDIERGANLLDCGEGAGADRRCDDEHIITSNGSFTMPIEPYDVETMDFVHYQANSDNDTDESDDIRITETLGFATHRAGGEVSLFSVSRRQNDGKPTFDNQLVSVIGGVVEGASGLAVNPLNREVYVVGQQDSSPHVAVLNVMTDLARGGSFVTNPWFSQSNTISISKEMMDGSGAREVAVSPDGRTGFVITQSPPALLKMDLENYQLTDMTSVCRESSTVDTFLDEQDPDDPYDDKLYAFVLCFITGQVYIIDTQYMIPVVRKTGEGPQDIAFDATRNIAYIANFSESTITMVQTVAPFNLIKVQPDGRPDMSLIVRIGEPNLPKGY